MTNHTRGGRDARFVRAFRLISITKGKDALKAAPRAYVDKWVYACARASTDGRTDGESVRFLLRERQVVGERVHHELFHGRAERTPAMGDVDDVARLVADGVHLGAHDAQTQILERAHDIHQ